MDDELLMSDMVGGERPIEKSKVSSRSKRLNRHAKAALKVAAGSMLTAIACLDGGQDAFAQTQTLSSVQVTSGSCSGGKTAIFVNDEFAGCWDGGSGGGGGGGGGTVGGGGGGGVNLTLNSQTNCTRAVLQSALAAGSSSASPDPAAAPTEGIALAYANPIDISNGQPVAAQYGATNGPGGFAIFPNLAAGYQAALASYNLRSSTGKTVTQLINTWAPPSINPNALSTTLAGIGMSSTTAAATPLSSLTSAQEAALIAAFAWQEGFKPNGC